MTARGRVRALVGASLVAATLAAALAGCTPARERAELWSPYGPPGFGQPGAPMPYIPSSRPEPEATPEQDAGEPPGLATLPPDPDLSLSRTFTLTDGTSTACTIELWALPDTEGGFPVGDAREKADRAGQVLRTVDWDAFLATPSDLPPLPADQPGASEGYLQSDEVSRRIVAELFRQVDGGGYSLMGQSLCE